MPPNQKEKSQTKLIITLIVIVCALVAVTHWPALSAKAAFFDDDQYLLDNILVQNPGWRSAKRFLSEVLEPTTVEGYYQPLAMISLMTDYKAGGRENYFMPFHRTSLMLHIANTALAILLLYLLFGHIWSAAAIGLLFGLHPMVIEPIAWIGERKTLLAAFFALWSLILLLDCFIILPTKYITFPNKYQPCQSKAPQPCSVTVRMRPSWHPLTIRQFSITIPFLDFFSRIDIRHSHNHSSPISTSSNSPSST